MQTGEFRGFQVALSEPGIAWIEFNRPERMNGMTSAMKRDLIEVVTQAQMSDEVRVVVFIGTGKAFSAGDDLKGYATNMQDEVGLVPPLPAGHDTAIGTYDGLRTVSQALNLAVRNLDKLTIAAINGVAIQTGFSLALACDFRLAADSARMGSATLRFALLPDEGGQHLLVQHLGLARVLDDVLDGLISRDTAANDYGVVVTAGLALDDAATAELRAQRRSG